MKVKSGRYNNASEVVREALRRMEDEDERALRLAKPTAEDLLTDLTEGQLAGIRWRVRASIEDNDAGKFVEYKGRGGLKQVMRYRVYRVSEDAERDPDEIFVYWATHANLGPQTE